LPCINKSIKRISKYNIKYVKKQIFMEKKFMTEPQKKRATRDDMIVRSFRQREGAVGPIVEDIAMSFGVSRSTVRNILKKHNIIGK